MKRKHLETIPEMAMRQIGYDYIRKFLIGVGIVLVLGLVVFSLAGCATSTATTSAVRTATPEETSQYGLKAGAHRYEYPDAVVFTVTSRVEDPEVNRNRDRVSISSDRNIAYDGTARVRMTDVTKECVRDTDACTVTTREILLVMRPEPLTDYPWEPSEVTASLSSSEWGMATMLIPTELALRVLVLEALDLRQNPRHPGGDCSKWSLTGDFNNVDHFEYEQRAARLLEKGGYVPAHAVLDAKKVLARYELAERGCMTPEDAAAEAAIEGLQLIAKILGTVWVDPNL